MKKFLVLGFAAAAVLLPASASAQAVISNGVVRLGVNATGHLNVRDDIFGTDNTDTGERFTGIQYVPTGNDALAPGCQCEGWGVGLSGGVFDGLSASANEDDGGATNMSVQSFTSTGVTATSVVTISNGIEDVLRVTHDFTPSTSLNLYEVVVTIENLSATETAGSGSDGLRYRRVMDWDVEPNSFYNWVKVEGADAAANVLFASNDGWASADPFAGPSDIFGYTGDFDWTGVEPGATLEQPFDHGALFDLGFAALAPGEIRTFEIFYGAASSSTALYSALASVDVEVYSMARCDSNFDASCLESGAPNTFGFGLRNVGGQPIPETVPEPITMTLLGTGLVGVAAARRRRTR